MSEKKTSTEEGLLSIAILIMEIGGLVMTSYFMKLIWTWYFAAPTGFSITTRMALGACLFVGLMRKESRPADKRETIEKAASSLGMLVGCCLILLVAYLARP